MAESRARAQALLMAGVVRVDGQVQTKAGQRVHDHSDITVDQRLPYVSRGGYKLAHALDTFSLSPNGLVALDVGASTGGFTDVLLQRGASAVYAVDVGYGQLDWRLRQDARVISLERTNIRYLETLPGDSERVECCTIDVSFISLRLILPVVRRFLADNGWVVALIKPQFEAGSQDVGKGGVVRDATVHRRVLREILDAAAPFGFTARGLTRSPIRGPAGNSEFLVWWGLDIQTVDHADLIRQGMDRVG